MSAEGYRFLDCGHGRRLEEMGGVVVARPAPAADFPPALDVAAWSGARLSYDRERGWEGTAPEDWRMLLDGVRIGLRPASQGQVGAFPEHAQAAESLIGRMGTIFPSGRRTVLNLFAHTGFLTLRLAALPGVDAAHVDAAPAAVKAARENAALSGLDGAPVRWLADDALAFMRREVRRGRKYDVIAADPPSFGRAAKGAKEWKLERDLPDLLAAASDLFAPGGGLFCLTCHSGGWTPERLAGAVREAFPGWRCEAAGLTLRSVSGGNDLPSGAVAFAWRDGDGKHREEQR